MGILDRAEKHLAELKKKEKERAEEDKRKSEFREKEKKKLIKGIEDLLLDLDGKKGFAVLNKVQAQKTPNWKDDFTVLDKNNEAALTVNVEWQEGSGEDYCHHGWVIKWEINPRFKPNRHSTSASAWYNRNIQYESGVNHDLELFEKQVSKAIGEILLKG